MQQASPTQSHTRPVHTRQFQSCLAAVIRRKRLSRAVRALFFGVIIDELTDIGWEHMLIVYLKYVDCETGELIVQFHALLELSAKDAETQYEALTQEIIEESELSTARKT